jgi:hypothetical protein
MEKDIKGEKYMVDDDQLQVLLFYVRNIKWSSYFQQEQ